MAMTVEQQRAIAMAEAEYKASMGGIVPPAPSGVDPATNQPPGVPAFSPQGVEGYDPQTGKVSQPGDRVGAFLSGALEGIPIVGPSVSNVTTDIAAGLVSPFSGQSFGDVRQGMVDRRKQVEEDNPGTAMSGGLASVVGTMIPLGLTAAGGRMLGMTGDSLLGRTVASGLSNMGINAADTAARGGDLPDVLKSGGKGLGIGLALPGAGALVSGTGRAVWDAVGPRIGAITNPLKEAANRVSSAFGADTRSGVPLLSSADEAAASANGQPLLNVDRGGESARSLARSAANNDPEARAIIDRKVSDRFASQNQRANSFIDRLMGGAPDDLALQDSIKSAARSANKPAYARAYQDGANGVMSPELERLAGSPGVASAMKAAAEKGQDRAIADGFGAFNPKVTFTPDGRVQFRAGQTGVKTYPDMQFWDYTYRELRDAASAAGRAGRNGEAETLGNLSKTLRGELDRAVPSYATARQGAASFFGAEDALDAGRKFVTLSKSLPETKRALASMSAPERESFAIGFSSELKDVIATVRDRANVIDRIYGTPEAREKIAMALGPQRAREFESFARVETIMDQLRGAMGNSTTARQMKELGMAGAAGAGAGYLTGDWKAGIGTAMLVRGARAYGTKVDETMAKNIAQLLLSDDPVKLRAAIQAGARNPKALEAIAAMQKFIGSTVRAVPLAAPVAQPQP